MPGGTVVLHLTRPRSFLETHEGRTLSAIARALAALKGWDFGGCHDEDASRATARFFVPDDTLTEAEAQRLGITSERDLFGGIVPHAFVATKVITHALVGEDAARPEGWSDAFTAAVRDVVLPGYTAFSRQDAEQAVRRLAESGSVRVKWPLAAGGRGQGSIASVQTLRRVLADVPDDELARHGLVLEANLDKVKTVSVGQVRVDDLVMSYHGIQRVTRDGAGREVYGGSDLVCVRGGWDAVVRLPLPPDVRHAVAQACRYDDATREYGVVASRRNYDVAQGVDGSGRWHSGVLEQGWRAGGASGAEVLALATLAGAMAPDTVSASSVELYGEGHVPPPDAVVHFAGIDPVAGPMLRYATVERPAAPRP